MKFFRDLLLGLLFAGLTSCASMDEIAPPVSAAMIHRSGADSGPVLGEGRRLYVTSCARCHGPEPVLDYSLVEWEPIIVDMGEESNLDHGEIEALKRYIEAVWAMHDSADPSA